ncbi:aspartate kinase [Candidatus Dojkabacteria bacterium]|nr:aspartate kinase [Candidatus Dojkabacteria bacterium]
MISVSKAVEKIIKGSPFLEGNLADGILNLSSLARIIKVRVEKITMKNVKEGAIVMALKRLHLEKGADKNKIIETLKQISDISVRSKLLEYTFSNSNNLFSKLSKLLEIVNSTHNRFLTISQGVFETTIIASIELREKIEKVFIDERLLNNFHSLSSITLKLPPRNVKVTGIYYVILRALAWENINVVDIVSTSNEITIIFSDKDIERAFSAIKEITSTKFQ